MNKYLVIETANWADEFDIQGFKIIEADSIKEVEDKLTNTLSFPCELGFGTNEDQYYNTKEELLNDIEINLISEEEFKVLDKLFEIKYSFGVTAIL